MPLRSLAAASAMRPVPRNNQPTGDEVREHLPLVTQAVARFLRRVPPSVLREDLVAAGTCGLLDALRRAPLDRGPAFEWYLRIRIRGAILDELRAQDWLTRRARKTLQVVKEGGPVTCIGVVSFDDLSDQARAATMTDENAPSPFEMVVQRKDRAALGAAVQKLPAREQTIVRMHYFMDVPFKSIAAELRVSEPRISQLHARAMTRLKSLMSCERDEAA
jgi:RNA polymerase sigma factor for flagellar operon FliA